MAVSHQAELPAGTGHSQSAHEPSKRTLMSFSAFVAGGGSAGCSWANGWAGSSAGDADRSASTGTVGELVPHPSQVIALASPSHQADAFAATEAPQTEQVPA